MLKKRQNKEEKEELAFSGHHLQMFCSPLYQCLMLQIMRNHLVASLKMRDYCHHHHYQKRAHFVLLRASM